LAKGARDTTNRTLSLYYARSSSGQSFLGVEGSSQAGAYIKQIIALACVYQFCPWTRQWLEGVRLCFADIYQFLQILNTAARSASTLSRCFRSQSCSLRYHYNPAELTEVLKGLGQRSVPRSRVKWSCCAAVMPRGIPQRVAITKSLSC
jgi:hypothetical protein